MPFSSVIGASSVIRPGVCTSTTRPTVPYEGQLIYETDTDRVAAYNGSAWVYTHSSGLVLVKSQTIGSAVSSVTVSDVFTATYDVYKITVSGGASNTTIGIQMTLGSANSGYYLTYIYSAFNSTSVLAQNINNGSGWAGVLNATTSGIQGSLDIISPFLAKRTYIQTNISNDGTNSGPQTGYLSDTNSYTSFTLAPSGGTLTGGTIRVYGYSNS